MDERRTTNPYDEQAQETAIQQAFLAEMQALYNKGHFLDMAEKFCHEGWAIESDYNAKTATVGICSFHVPFPYSDGPVAIDAAPNPTLLEMRWFHHWPRSAQDAMQQVADEILRQIKGGSLGC